MYRQKTTLEQWRILQAVVDCGGYAHAAKTLNKSQSSLNHAVAKLQGQLNVQLLEVKGRKAFLTKAGEVMLRRSRLLSQSAQELEELANNINQGWEPEIIIAADLAFPRPVLLPILKHFQPLCRGSRITLLDTVLSGSEEAVKDKSADIVITNEVPRGFLHEPLIEVNFVAVTHPQHPLTQLPSPIDPQELQQHVQVVIRDSGQNPHDDRGWLRAEQRWTVSQFHSAVDILLEGIGFCWLPQHHVERYIEMKQLVTLNVKGSSFKRVTLSLVNPNSEQMGPGTQMLTEMILAERQISQ
ncbi:LysR family transcriptional regulator [Alteromonas sp. a30]|uniref:LysR family transcriptional regulator n=1 Tax=Alteromonas sp. a30 TaxID=2730917 RepID=UPI00227DB1D8|nr:LysR family transcriptional regulator [Alteromonas sp. a30]MCY7294189.1 LysR family transcriptional regulator [Alteromonas sp. a30]